MICAGFSNGHGGACQGDSGGPFTYDGKVLGVVSFGAGCNRHRYPGVYMNVAFYRNWIDKQMSYNNFE